jgi:hypothetical protein
VREHLSLGLVIMTLAIVCFVAGGVAFVAFLLRVGRMRIRGARE